MRRLAFLLMALVLVLGAAACGGGEDESASPETVEGTLSTDTSGAGGEGETSAETGEGTVSTDTSGAGGDSAAEGNAENGKSLFASNGCGGCHIYGPAGSSGNAGPNLDEAQPDFDEAYDQIEKGGGGMPAFGDRLSDQEIADLAAFVSQGG
jgi:mono/diheme cytochrome c family protein